MHNFHDLYSLEYCSEIQERIDLVWLTDVHSTGMNINSEKYTRLHVCATSSQHASKHWAVNISTEKRRHSAPLTTPPSSAYQYRSLRDRNAVFIFPPWEFRRKLLVKVCVFLLAKWQTMSWDCNNCVSLCTSNRMKISAVLLRYVM